MKIVLDTNVLISGAFFSGPPAKILDACFENKVTIAITREILEEYRRVGNEFSKQRANLDFSRFLGVLLTNTILVEPSQLDEPVCQDPDDDMFISCAISAKTKLIVSGDKHLLDISGYRGIQVIRPNDFLKRNLER